MKYFFLSVLLTIAFGQPALATPAQVLIIRHGEKIDDVNPHLSAVGKKRAAGLIHFFTENPQVNAYGPPAGIFAAAPAKEGKSVRPYETVAPLAKHLEQAVNLDFEANDIKKLVGLILKSAEYDGRTVLISWTNSEIPKLANMFGAKGVPSEWDSATFDRVWKIPFSEDGTPGKLEDIPQRVLPGDSEE